jgi:single-strand DNA-binding protein
MSFARLEIFGNLGGDPETRYTPNGNMVVEFSIAVNNWRKPNDPPTWYRCSAWGDLANRIDGLAQKGSIQKGYSLLVRGPFEPRAWTANDGSERISFDINVESFDFTGGGRRNDESSEEPNF